jgi:hypothetical protein
VARLRSGHAGRHQSMIPKSGYRFSEKIMLRYKRGVGRVPGGAPDRLLRRARVRPTRQAFGARRSLHVCSGLA